MEGGFHLDDATLGIFSIGLHALGDDIDALHDGALLFGLHFEHTAGLTLVVARVDIDRIALFDM